MFGAVARCRPAVSAARGRRATAPDEAHQPRLIAIKPRADPRSSTRCIAPSTMAPVAMRALRTDTRGTMFRPLATISRRDFLQAGTASIVGATLTSVTSASSRAQGEPQVASVRALVFDVFGTVVDWR